MLLAENNIKENNIKENNIKNYIKRENENIEKYLSKDKTSISNNRKYS